MGGERRLPRAERELRMLDAAARVFGERGFRAASMDEIAAGSGITKALLYQYFASKERLYEACVERARADLFAGLGRAVAGLPPGPEQLRAFAEHYFAFVEEHRGAWWMLYGESSLAATEEMRARNAEVVGAMLAEALEAAGREAQPRAIEFLAHGLVGYGEQIARWWRGRPEIPRTEVVDRFVAQAAGAIAVVFSEPVPDTPQRGQVPTSHTRAARPPGASDEA